MRLRSQTVCRTSASRTKAGLAISILLIAGLTAVSHAPVARAAEVDFKVQVGAVHPTNPDAPYGYTRYYPDVLRVHRGQTVQWEWAPEAFHTVTFSDAGRPHFLRPDDLPGTYATPQEWSLGGGCGRPTEDPCTLTEDTAFISSGVIIFGASPFTVTIDAPAGSYNYFCTVHPTMSGTIEVVPDTEALPTPEQVEDQAAEQIATDSARADAVFEAGQTPSSTIEDGQRVWQVKLGDATPDEHVNINAYLPANLDIDPGDKVRFVYPDGFRSEIHSVTFPSDLVGNFGPPPRGLGGFGFHPSCDLDDPTTGAKGIPGSWGIQGPPCPGTLELVLAPWMTRSSPAPGNLVPTPVTYHDSGILMPAAAPEVDRRLPDTGELLPFTFEAVFPASGTFSFACTVHSDAMSGGITTS